LHFAVIVQDDFSLRSKLLSDHLVDLNKEEEATF
jgi:hypothetical protein